MRAHAPILAAVYATLSIFSARSTWGQDIHGLNGILTPHERNAATDSLIETDAAVYIQDEATVMRVTVLSDSIGIASLCVGTAEQVLVLHSSAALGMLDYRREGAAWATPEPFAWALGDTAMTPAAREARQSHLQVQGWVASTWQMGHPGETESLILRDRLPEGNLYLALGIMPITRPTEIVGLPSESAGDCARVDLLRGPAPMTGLHFEPTAWKQVGQ